LEDIDPNDLMAQSFVLEGTYDGPHPTDIRVSFPVTGFCPFKVGFLQICLIPKDPMAASVKSEPSKSASSKVVPVKTAFVKMVPRRELPLKLALSTIAFVKSAPSKFDAE
jgi:hypothetical protein